MNMVYCRGCAATIHETAPTCPKCGAVQFAARPAQSQAESGGKNKMTAGLFAILLGGIGVHRFYLGQTGLGVGYIALALVFVSPILGLIDGIRYLTMSDDAWIQYATAGRW